MTNHFTNLNSTGNTMNEVYRINDTLTVNGVTQYDSISAKQRAHAIVELTASRDDGIAPSAEACHIMLLAAKHCGAEARLLRAQLDAARYLIDELQNKLDTLPPSLTR